MTVRCLLALLILPLCAAFAPKPTTTSMGRIRGAPPAAIIGTSLIGGAGQIIGSATLTQDPEGTRIAATVTGLPIGRYRVALHATGRCDAPGFATAGKVLPGEYPVLVVGDDHLGVFDAVGAGIQLVGGSAALLDADGAALVLTGEAGGRAACGVIARAPSKP